MGNNKKSIYNFPVGFYDDLHEDFSINFQMNRFYNWTSDEEMLKEMREVSPTIHIYEEYIKAFLELGEKAIQEKKKLKAAFYFRGAEFYISDKTIKQNIRSKFISLTREYYGIKEDRHYNIPYENGFISAYRFTCPSPKGSLVIFGGFDSYIEELFPICNILNNEGYDVVCFDGPGQGTALEEYRLPLTHEWEKPVKAVLDYFKLEDVTLMGISLGGYLVMRAAAFDKRVKRVVADDICADFYQIMLRQIPEGYRDKINELITKESVEEINMLYNKLMQQNLMIKWAIMQGMHITGSDTPYEFISKMMKFNTTEISPLVTQDVLLLAAKEDHYIPLDQFFQQSKALINVRSLTARLFTREEQAHNHCHVGNIGLSIRVITDWMKQMEE